MLSRNMQFVPLTFYLPFLFDFILLGWLLFLKSIIYFWTYCLLCCSSFSGPIMDHVSSSTAPDRKVFEQRLPIRNQVEGDSRTTQSHKTEPETMPTNVCRH